MKDQNRTYQLPEYLVQYIRKSHFRKLLPKLTTQINYE